MAGPPAPAGRRFSMRSSVPVLASLVPGQCERKGVDAQSVSGPTPWPPASSWSAADAPPTPPSPPAARVPHRPPLRTPQGPAAAPGRQHRPRRPRPGRHRPRNGHIHPLREGARSRLHWPKALARDELQGRSLIRVAIPRKVTLQRPRRLRSTLWHVPATTGTKWTVVLSGTSDSTARAPL